MNNKISYLILLFVLTFPAGLYAADIQVKVDRTQIEFNQTFTLTFESSEDLDNDPDFSPLKKDFQILNTSTSSNISIINGKYTKLKRWKVSLIALRKGRVTIPSISFGSDRSPEYQVNIKAVQQSTGKQGEEFMSELEISTDTAYPQSQIIVTQRLLSSRNINGYEFSALKVNGVEIVKEPLGDVKQFQTRRGKTPYLVLEQNFAIYPQTTGVLNIEPSIATARVSLSNRSNYDPFRSNTKTLRRASAKKSITVKSVPVEFKGKHWLPAKEVQLVEELDDSKPFKVGEPITRTLSLFADGQTAAQLPEFIISDIKGLKLYPDQPLIKDIKTDSGITGSQQIKIAIIPSSGGSYTLPAIAIPWWNTTTHKQEIATIAARTIQVGTAAAKSTPKTDPQLQDNRQAIVDSNMTTEFSAPVNSPNSEEQSGLWKMISFLLVTGWIISLFIFWKISAKKSTEKSQPDTTAISLKQSYKQLGAACERCDAQACKTALLYWANAIFIDQPVYSLGDLAAHVNDKLKNKIIDLNSHLYNRQNTQWQCDDLLALCEDYAANYISNLPQADNNKLEDLWKL